MARIQISVAVFLACVLLRGSLAATVPVTTAETTSEAATTISVTTEDATAASTTMDPTTTSQPDTTAATTEAPTAATTEATTAATTEATTVATTEATTVATTEATTVATTEATTVATTEATTAATTAATTVATTEATTVATTAATTVATTAATSAVQDTTKVDSTTADVTTASPTTEAPTTTEAAAAADAAAAREAMTTTEPATTAGTTTPEVCIYDKEGCPSGHSRNPDPEVCECLCANKPHPTNPAMYLLARPPPFEAIQMPCAPGTVWSVEACKCDHPSAVQTITNIKDIPVLSADPPCVSVINYAFNPYKGEYTADQDGHKKVGLENHKRPLELVEAEGSSGNRSASFSNNSVEIPYIKGNGLTSTMYLEARFQPIVLKDNVTRVILSNGCTSTSIRDTQPSVLLSYNAAEGGVYVTIRTKFDSNGFCKDVKAEDGWIKVTISVEKSNTIVQVNNKPCAKFAGKGEIATTLCNLTIGGDPLRNDFLLDFNGFVDYVKVLKHCSKPDKTQ